MSDFSGACTIMTNIFCLISVGGSLGYTSHLLDRDFEISKLNHIGFCPPNSSGKCTATLAKTFISTAQRAMAGRDLDVTFAPRKLLSSATCSSSSGTQCRGGADPARHSLCGCRSTSLHMLHGSACCKTPSNAMEIASVGAPARTPG